MLLSLFSLDLWLLVKIPVLLAIAFALYVYYLFGYSVSRTKARFIAQNLPFVKILGHNVEKEAMELLEKHNDLLYPIREGIKKHPNAKGLVMQFGTLVTLSFTDPAYIKEYANRVIQDYDVYEGYKIITTLLHNGILSLAGEDWKVRRKIMADSFRFDVLEKNIAANQDSVIEFFNSLSESELNEFAARDQMVRMLADITSYNFFGENFSKKLVGDTGKTLLTRIFDCTSQINEMSQSLWVMLFGYKTIKYGILPSHRQCNADCKQVQNFLTGLVREKRKTYKSGSRPVDKLNRNFLEELLEAEKDYPKQAHLFDDASIAGEYMTFLIAGTYDLSITFSIFMYIVSSYPDLVADLRKEIAEHIPGGKVTSISQLNKLELLHSTVKEVLRIYPAAAFTIKTAYRDTQVLDIKIKKGDHVGYGIEANGANPKYWENPEKFEPRRFMKGVKDSSSDNKEPFAYIPFGTGMRNCVGQHFGFTQGKLVLVTLMTMFDSKVVPDYKFKMTMNLSYEPLDQVKLVLTKRSSAK